MAFFLPAQQGFGEQLIGSISNLANRAGEGYLKEKTKKADESIIKQLADQSAQRSPLQNIMLASQLSPERQKAILEAYNTQFKEQEKGKRQLANERERGKQYAAALSAFSQGPAAFQQYQNLGQIDQSSDSGSPLNGAPVSEAPSIGAPTQVMAREGLAPGAEAAAVPGLAGSQGDVGKQPQRAREWTDEELAALSADKVIGPAAQQTLAGRRAKAKSDISEKQYANTQTAKFAEELRQNADQAHEVTHAIKTARQAIKNGATGLKARNIAFKFLQSKNSPFANLFQTEDTQKLISATKALSGGFRQVFGAKPTEREFFWYENILPDLLKSGEVNEASLKYFENVANINLRAQEVADEIVKANGGYRPIDIDRQVREKLRPELDKVINEGYGMSGKKTVYDPEGKAIGTVNASEAASLPKGYIAK